MRQAGVPQTAGRYAPSDVNNLGHAPSVQERWDPDVRRWAKWLIQMR